MEPKSLKNICEKVIFSNINTKKKRSSKRRIKRKNTFNNGIKG